MFTRSISMTNTSTEHIGFDLRLIKLTLCTSINMQWHLGLLKKLNMFNYTNLQHFLKKKKKTMLELFSSKNCLERTKRNMKRKQHLQSLHSKHLKFALRKAKPRPVKNISNKNQNRELVIKHWSCHPLWFWRKMQCHCFHSRCLSSLELAYCTWIGWPSVMTDWKKVTNQIWLPSKLWWKYCILWTMCTRTEEQKLQASCQQKCRQRKWYARTPVSICAHPTTWLFSQCNQTASFVGE